jgi:hypothetical protein
MPLRQRPDARLKPPSLHELVRQQVHNDAVASPLGQWMVKHLAELRVVLGTSPDWGVIAYEFSRAGLRDSTDRKPTAEMAELTYRAVMKDYES